MKKILTLSTAIILSTLASASFAGDAVAGKAKSVTCAGCHGANGISNNPMWPHWVVTNTIGAMTTGAGYRLSLSRYRITGKASRSKCR